MNIIRSSIKSQVLDLKSLSIFSPLKRGIMDFLFGNDLRRVSIFIRGEFQNSVTVELYTATE